MVEKILARLERALAKSNEYAKQDKWPEARGYLASAVEASIEELKEKDPAGAGERSEVAGITG